MKIASSVMRTNARQFMRILTVLSGFFVFYTGGALLGWIVLPSIRLWTRDSGLGRRRCQRVVCETFRWMLWYLEFAGIFTTNVCSRDGTTLDKIRLDEPAIIIANHPSLLDVVLLMSAMEEGVVVVKSWVYFNPFWGGLAWCCGFIRGGSGLARGMAVIREAAQRVEEGSRVLLFPEGTRSPKGDLGDFQRGAFRIARISGAPIAPVRIRCEPAVLGKGQPLGDFPSVRPVQFEARTLWEERPDRFVRDEDEAKAEIEKMYRLIHCENEQLT